MTIATGEALGSPAPTRDRDTGCIIWPACLSCPLARYVYDYPRGTRAGLHQERDAAIDRLYYAGRTIADLVDLTGLSRRQIYRIIAQQREGTPV